MKEKNIKQKRIIICLKGKFITEMLAAVTCDSHRLCYTSNPSLMTGLESELYTRNGLIYKQLQHYLRGGAERNVMLPFIGKTIIWFDL